MQFLADQNFPLPSVRRLRSSGHDVASILEDAAGVSDSDVIERAVREQRILLTFDGDFGRILNLSGRMVKTSVVFFRVPFLSSPEEPAELLLLALADASLTWTNTLTVIQRNKTRQRALL